MPKEQDAIQEEEIKDVSADTELADTKETEVDEKKPAISEHSRMLEELAAKRQKDLYPEVKEEPKEIEEPEVKTEIEPEPVNQEEEKRKIKVDGEEREVPLSKILDAGIRAIQKESTADKRLEEATRLLREAAEKAQPSSDVAAKQPEEDTEYREFVKKTVDALQYGDDTQVEAAVKSLESRILEKAKSGAPQVNIAEEVRVQLALSNIHAELAKPYNPDNEDSGGCPDLLGNPILRQAVKDRVDKKMQQGMNGLDVSTYKEAAKEIRSEFRTIFNVKPVNKPGEIVDKEKRVERKRQITSVNVAAGKVETKPPDKKQTPSEIVEELAKKRGQIM